MRNSRIFLVTLATVLYSISALGFERKSNSNSHSGSQKSSKKTSSPFFSNSEAPSLTPSHSQTSYSSFKPSDKDKDYDRSKAPFISGPESPSISPSIQFNNQYPTSISSAMPSTPTSKDRTYAPVKSITDVPSIASIPVLNPSSNPLNNQPTSFPLESPTSSKPTLDHTSTAPINLSSEAPSRMISLVPSKSPAELISPSPSTAQFPSSPYPVKSLSPTMIHSSNHPHMPTYSDDKGASLGPTISRTSSLPTTLIHPTSSPAPSDVNLNHIMSREQMEWLASRIGPPPPGIKCEVEDDCGSDGTCIHNFCYAFETTESSVEMSENLLFIVITSLVILISMELLV